MSPQALVLTLATVVLNGSAQLLLRGAALRGAVPTQPMTLLRSPLFMIGLVTYGVSVLTWLAVLRRVPLSIATPFVALVYVAVPIAAKVVFGDHLSWRMALGMAFVAVGVTLVGKT